MHRRIDIIMADGTRRKGFATTEHATSSYGQPVILIDDIPHGTGDMAMQGAKIVTQDEALKKELESFGYTVAKETRKTFTARIDLELHASATRIAKDKGITLSEAIDEALKDWISKNE